VARQAGVRSRINQPSSLTEIQITEADMNEFITNNFNSAIYNDWVNNYLLAAPPVNGEGLVWDSVTSKWISKAAAGVGFKDEFKDASRFWGWADDPKNGSIVEAGDVVTLSIADGIDGRLGGGAQNAPRCLIGDPGAPLEVKTLLNSYTVRDSTQAGLCLSTQPENASLSFWLLFGRTMKSDQGLDGLAVQDPNAAAGWLFQNAFTTMPVWLRMRITVLHEGEAGICECAYSTDDESYTVLGVVALNLVSVGSRENIALGIFARNRVGSESVIYIPAIDAPFDEFSTKPITNVL